MKVSFHRAALIAAVTAVVLGGRSIAIFSRGNTNPTPSASLERRIQDLDRRYKLELLREMPEDVTALTVASDQSSDLHLNGKVFVGTTPAGGVYAFNLMAPQTYLAIGEGLGDSIQYGMCDVNSLAIHDLNRDGIPELLATTSQIVPRGRPRLYVWSLAYPHAMIDMIRPGIESSWSHGIGLLERPDASSSSIYVTFCGQGEIVEYRLTGETDEAGFSGETLRWKKVGQLPASGEWIESTDVDHDGQTEVCVATGYAPGRAAIHVYAGDRPGTALRLKQVIDEAGHFGNVRFIVGPTCDDGIRHLIAWWCQELDGGESAVVRYRLGPGCIRERVVIAQGTSELYWPKDGQIAVMDLDGDGGHEVWFANTAGGLWRLDPTRSLAPERIVQIKGGFGPIAAAVATPSTPAALLVGLGQSVLRLIKNPALSSSTACPGADPLDSSGERLVTQGHHNTGCEEW
jgi:hypothetical protein